MKRLTLVNPTGLKKKTVTGRVAPTGNPTGLKKYFHWKGRTGSCTRELSGREPIEQQPEIREAEELS